MGLLDTIQRRDGGVALAVQGGGRPAARAVQGAGNMAVVGATGRSPVLAMPTEVRQKAMQRLDFVRAVLAKAEAARCPLELACNAVAAAEGERFPDLAHAGKHGASALTYINFRNWRSRIGGADAEEALAKLADKYVGGRVAFTACDGGKEFLRLFARFYETEKQLSLAEAYRLAVATAKSDKWHAEMIPTEDQVRYHYREKVDQPSLLQARMGKDWAENNLAGYITRDWSMVQAGEVWFGDHHVFDAPVKMPKAEGGWKPVRPWLTAWMDAKSRYLVGWIIRADESPNSLVIEDALLKGIRDSGNRPPVLLYTDNGKDYVSQGFVQPVVMEGTEHSICRELGCQALTALPYNARAKTIERFFKDLATGFAKYWAGYLGNRPGNRPESAKEYWDNPETLPTLQQFTEAFAWWLEHMFNHRPSDSAATGGRSPAEVWGSRPELRPVMTDQQLYMAFLKPLAQPRQVKRGGRLTVAGRDFQSRELWPLIGKNVLIKIDRFDATRVHAFHADGRWICEAQAVQALPAIGADRDQLSAAMADNRRLLAHSRELIRERTGEMRVVSPMERIQLAIPEATPDQVREQMAAAAEPERRSQGEDAEILKACEEAVFGSTAQQHDPQAREIFDFSEPMAETSGPVEADAATKQALAEMEGEDNGG